MSELDRGAVIGFLASATPAQRREIHREVWKILAAQAKSDERSRERELLREIEEAFAGVGVRVLGLEVGGANSDTRRFLRGVWTHKRARHLLLPSRGGLASACLGEWIALDRLGDLKLDLAVRGAGPCCAACMESRPRKKGRGIWAPQGPYRWTQSLTALELGTLLP